jgi:predicted RNase H-like nuclease
MVKRMQEYFIGIDLAWKRKNRSFIIAIKGMNATPTVIDTTYADFDEIDPYIKQYDPTSTLIGIDAPLIVNNESGNRQTEIDFLKDYAKYGLGVYPVNRQLLLKTYGVLTGVELFTKMPSYSFIEVYPHATILNLFHNQKVLPYKYKKGRNKAFYIEQLEIYTDYLSGVIDNINLKLFDTSTLKTLKHYEDYLDSITCAYTVYYCEKYPELCQKFGSKYNGLLYVPLKKESL